MSDVQYRVVTTYEGIDKQSSTVKGISGASQMLSTAAASAGSMMDSLGAKIAGVAKMAAAAAVGGGIYLLKRGLFDVNAELEASTNAMASTLNILGGAGSFAQGLQMSQKLVAGIRKDSAALPGEFQDFVGIAQNLTPALTNAGKGIKDIRDLTKLTAVAAASVGVGFDQAGREMAQLLAGHAGAHNVLGMRLGIDTHTQVAGKDFNKATDLERLAFIQEKLAKAQDSLPAFTNSWAGLTSTMADGVKTLLGESTLPLFERLKDSMKGAITWLDSPAAHAFAHTVSVELVDGFDFLADKAHWIADHWSSIRADGLAFVHGLEAGVARVWPTLEKAGSLVANKLHDDPVGFLKSIAATRVGLGIVARAPSIASTFSSLGGSSGVLGAVGGAGASVAGVAALAALVAVLDNVGGSAERAQNVLGSLVNSLQVGVAPLIAKGGVMRDVFGGLGMVLIQIADMNAFGLSGVADGLHFLNEQWQNLKDGAASLTAKNQDLASVNAEAAAQSEGLTASLKFLAVASLAAINPLYALAYAAKKIAQFSSGTGDSDDPNALRAFGLGDVLKGAKRKAALGGENAMYVPKVIDDDAATKLEKSMKDIAGKGGTKVNVVNNFDILSDSDPERLAKKVSHEVAMSLRHPKFGFGFTSFRHG